MEAGLLLKKKLNFQAVSGLVQQRVPKAGDDYRTLIKIRKELGPDHPLVQFVLKKFIKRKKEESTKNDEHKRVS